MDNNATMATVKFGNKVGTKIKQERKKKGIKLDVLSEATGLNVVYLNLIERNRRTVNLNTLIKIASGLNLPVLDFEQYQI